MDRFTFEFAEPQGKVYFSAFGRITKEFIQAFRENKHYEVVLSAFLQRLFTHPEMISLNNYEYLEKALFERANAILAEERMLDKLRLTKGRKPVYELRDEDEDEDDEMEEEAVLTEAEQQRREAERLERERLEEERRAAREEERRRNEEILRSRARQVDAKAMEKVLQGAVLLNSGQMKPKGGGKQKQERQTTAEDVREMELQVSLLMKEKERLHTVLHAGESELPRMLEEARKELEAAECKLKSQTDVSEGDAVTSMPSQSKQMAARVAELKQKVLKVTTDRNRLSLQLKAQPHPLREEILSLMRQRDEVLVKLERA